MVFYEELSEDEHFLDSLFFLSKCNWVFWKNLKFSR